MIKSNKSIIIVLLAVYLLLQIAFVPLYNGGHKVASDKQEDQILTDSKNTKDIDGVDLHNDPGVSTRTAGNRYFEDHIDLNDAAVQLSVISEDQSDNAYSIAGGSPMATGDIDNDGFDDLIIGCPYADGFDDTVSAAGQVMVVYGRNQTHPHTVFDQASRDFDEINLYIHGATGSDFFGFTIACGNIDGDNYDDLVIGAPYGDGKNNLRTNSGEVYVFYGRSRNSFGEEIDLLSTAPDLIIYGENTNDWSAYSVAVGNVIGDSKDDIIIGALFVDLPGKVNYGRTYVVKGDTRTNLGTEIDLLTDADVYLNGIGATDYTGFKVAGGDLNGDSRDDIIVGAPYSDYSGRVNAGMGFVVYGQQTLSSELNLGNESDINILGAGASDYLGYGIATGNINGDSYDDLIISTPYGDGPNNGQAQSGEAYVIFGDPNMDSTYDLNNNEQDIVIYGEDANDYFGYSVAAGNVNNDLYDDILIGAMYGDGEDGGILSCGDTYLILGNSTADLGTNIDPRTESKTIFYGVDAWDVSGRFVHIGDLDGDMHGDVIIGAPLADGPNNARSAVGEFYVIFGAPPRIRNEHFEFIDGDIDNRTILTRYKPYTFEVESYNLLGHDDFKTITFTLDPGGYNISYRWSKLDNKFTPVNDPLALVECISGLTDVVHDNNYTYFINFKFIFNWNFSKESPIDCMISSNGMISRPDVDLFTDVFIINNKLNLYGDLQVEGLSQGSMVNNDWVKGNEKLTFSGLTVVYDGTADFYPPDSDYSLALKDGFKINDIPTPEAGGEIITTLDTPADTVDLKYTFKILNLPQGCDNSSKNFSLRIDNDPPKPPASIYCYADSFDESEPALHDNDPHIFFAWSEATDVGSGTTGYYYGFSNGGGTDQGFLTSEVQAQLKNATEGSNTIFVWAEDKVGNIGFAGSNQIFIDLTDITYIDFVPSGDDWLTSSQVDCSIVVCDYEGLGVDPESIEYWNMYDDKWYPIKTGNNGSDLSDLIYIDVSLTMKFNDSSDNVIKFRATDLAGNGPTESAEYHFKIDSTQVTFTDVKPKPAEKQVLPVVKCYISVNDLQGSGVNLSTIQYSYTTNGIGNFSAWSSEGLALLGDPMSAKYTSQWFIELDFRRGGDNYIRWRAKDMAGNGYTVSESYPVHVNALPTIIIDELDPEVIYYTNEDFVFSANSTYDMDDAKEKLTFSWSSNISGHLGNGESLTVQLPAGLHRITLTVGDGLNNATRSFNIKVQRPESEPKSEPTKDPGSTVASESSNYFIFGLILLVVIIVLVFLFLFSRERKTRRALEDKILLDKSVVTEVSYVPPTGQPMIPGMAPGSEDALKAKDAATQILSSKAATATDVTQDHVKQLPTVAATAAPVAGVATGTTTGYQVPQVPQLPPAQGVQTTMEPAKDITQPEAQQVSQVPTMSTPASAPQSSSTTSQPKIGLTPDEQQLEREQQQKQNAVSTPTSTPQPSSQTPTPVAVTKPEDEK